MRQSDKDLSLLVGYLHLIMQNFYAKDVYHANGLCSVIRSFLSEFVYAEACRQILQTANKVVSKFAGNVAHLR